MGTFMQDALERKVDYSDTIWGVFSKYEDFLEQVKQRTAGCPCIYGYPFMPYGKCFNHNDWTCEHCYKLAFKYY